MDSLRFIAGPMQGQVVDLTMAYVTLGREPGNQVPLEGDPGVSRQHARIYRDGPALHVADVGSANGTLVNGLRIGAPTPIRVGDVVQIATHIMRLEGNAAMDPTHVFAQSPLAGMPPEPALPVQMMSPSMPMPMGQPMPQGPMAGYPYPPQMPNVVVTQNVVMPQQPNHNWIWNLAGLLVLCSCLLASPGPVGTLIVPGEMIIGGAILGVIGWMDYQRFAPYREWYQETRKATIKLVLGVGIALLGLAMLGNGLLSRNSSEGGRVESNS